MISQNIQLEIQSFNSNNIKSCVGQKLRLTLKRLWGLLILWVAAARLNCMPENTDLSRLPEAEQVKIDIDLHYSSKFAQNSATTVEIKAEITEGDSYLRLDGKVKTAAPWLFMPFEVIDPVQTGTDTAAVLDPYMTDWISNAASMIRHNNTEMEINPVQTQMENQTAEQQEKENQNHEDDQNPEAETAPLDETGTE